MESFYGGRKGISFIIVKHFDGLDIPQPNDNGEYIYTGDYFALENNGDNFRIDTETNEPIVRTTDNQDDYTWRYHLNDGSRVVEGHDAIFPIKLALGMKQCFEQGGETSSEVGYGEYVIIDTIVNLHDYSHIDNGKVFRRGMDYQAELGGAEYVGQIVGPQGDTPIVEMNLYDEIISNDNFREEHFNKGAGEYTIANNGLISGIDQDEIKYAWVEMKDAFGNTEGVQLGFSFPYTVIEMVAERVNAYTDPVFTRLTQPIAEGGDNGKPYFYKWKVSIPEGLHGIDSKNIVVYDAEDGSGKRLGYTQTDYTTNGNGVDTFIDIGEYKMISGVTLSSDGILTVAYTYGQPTPMDEVIRWIENDSLTGARGVELADDGTITINYNTGEINEYQNALTWITEASLEETGEFKLLFNNNANSNVQDIQKTLEWVRRVEIADDGTLTFYYNTLDDNGNENIAFKRDNFLKVISDVQINTGAIEGDGSQKVVVTYNTGEVEEIGNALNYVIETKITTEADFINYGVDAYHLLVLYADPARRGTVTCFSEEFNIDRNDWIDLGYVRGEAGGIHIIGDFPSIAELQDDNGQWLPPTQVEGWLEERSGWAYTIDEKAIYTYDYLNNRWYSIGDLSLSTPDKIIIIDTATNGRPSSLDSILQEKGIWLVAETVKFAE